jgi:hypothetical protein
MRANAYFGDLRVATLTDSVGLPARYRAAAGWRRGPSNFLLATSRALNHALTPELVYAARRDGDGLVNLLPPPAKAKRLRRTACHAHYPDPGYCLRNTLCAPTHSLLLHKTKCG